MKNIISAILLIILFVSCKSEKKTEQKEAWKTANYIDSVQILLTNDYQLDESSTSGASSFLIHAKGDTLLCTAKHLLGEDMGVSPQIPVQDFNTSLVYWKAFPRTSTLSSDTLYVSKMITDKPSSFDIILMKTSPTSATNFMPLTPRFSQAEKGEKFTLIGCEYSDPSCYQAEYTLEMDVYEAGMMVMIPQSDFDPSGFSGAPVIDENGYVIGVLSGGIIYDDETFLSIQPVSALESYLK